MMEEIVITFQRIENRPINIINLRLIPHEDLTPSEGGYNIQIIGFMGFLELDVPGGEDDIYLIKGCIEENIHDFKWPREGHLDVVLKESGEWQGYEWVKWYEVDRVATIEY